MLGGGLFFAVWLGPAENDASGSGDIGSIYRRLAARLRDYGPAAYWMSLTLEELSYWLDDIMEVVKDEQEAITEAREEAANNR